MAKLILCTDQNNGIGYKNQIPWHSSADFQHFKEETLNRIIVMGFNTWKSLPKRPLQNRLNVVVLDREYSTALREENELDSSCIFISSSGIQSFIENNPECIIIGGAKLYDHAYQYCTDIIKSTVQGTYQCDAFVDPYMYKDFTVQSTKVLSDGTLVEYMKRD